VSGTEGVRSGGDPSGPQLHAPADTDDVVEHIAETRFRAVVLSNEEVAFEGGSTRVGVTADPEQV